MFAFCFVVVVFLIVKHIILMKFHNYFCNVNLFRIIKVLQNVWQIIRVSRYRPSIFNSVIYWFLDLVRCFCLNFATYIQFGPCLNMCFVLLQICFHVGNIWRWTKCISRTTPRYIYFSGCFLWCFRVKHRALSVVVRIIYTASAKCLVLSG